MKRLSVISLLLLLAIICYTQDGLPFTHLVKTSKGMVSMSFHTGNDKGGDGLGVALGDQEYDHPVVPADFKGEIFLPDSILVPDGRQLPLRWISRGSFQNCTGITEVHLPLTAYSISDLSFQNCKSLRQITIPDSFRVIYPRAFLGCTGLRRIVLLPAVPPQSYNNDTFDEVTYQMATVVFPAQSSEDYINNPLCYRFRYHAELIPSYHEQGE